jgi:hypothetical protein
VFFRAGVATVAEQNPGYLDKFLTIPDKIDLAGKIVPEVDIPGQPGIFVRFFLEFPLAEPCTEVIFLPFVGSPERCIIIYLGIADRVVRHRYHTPG